MRRVLFLSICALALFGGSARAQVGRTSRTDLDKLRRGGIGAVAFAIAVGSGPRTADGVAAARKEADEKLAAIRAFVNEHRNDVALATSAEDIEPLHKAGKIARDRSSTCRG